MYKNLSLNMNVNKNSSGIYASIILKNTSEKNIYLQNDVILLDGFTSNKFSIFGPANYKCSVPEVKYYPESFLLKAKEERLNILNLSEFCYPTSKEGGAYLVKFKTYVQECLDPEMTNCSPSFELSGESKLILGDE